MKILDAEFADTKKQKKKNKTGTTQQKLFYLYICSHSFDNDLLEYGFKIQCIGEYMYIYIS